MQYLRFALVFHDPDSLREQGLLIASQELLESGDLLEAEREGITGLCAWFNANVPVPKVLKMDQHFRAVSWFRADATEAIAKMWELKALLEAQGLQVQVLRSNNPGSIVHGDAIQVVAVSKKQSR